MGGTLDSARRMGDDAGSSYVIEEAEEDLVIHKEGMEEPVYYWIR